MVMRRKSIYINEILWKIYKCHRVSVCTSAGVCLCKCVECLSHAKEGGLKHLIWWFYFNDGQQIQNIIIRKKRELHTNLESQIITRLSASEWVCVSQCEVQSVSELVIVQAAEEEEWSIESECNNLWKCEINYLALTTTTTTAS